MAVHKIPIQGMTCQHCVKAVKSALEYLPGVKTYAVPITRADGQRVAAVISVTVPSERKDDQALLHALWSASTDIGRALNRR